MSKTDIQIASDAGRQVGRGRCRESCAAEAPVTGPSVEGEHGRTNAGVTDKVAASRPVAEQ